VKGDASTKGPTAFTLVELLVIIATLLVVAFLWFPSLTGARKRAIEKNCSNNLKEVGLAFRIWTSVGGGSYSTGASTNDGGTKELVASGLAFVHFLAMSNELQTPSLLVCPADKAKTVATNFVAGFSDRNVNYFVGADARDTNPQMFLSGDRNLATRGQPNQPGLFVLTTNTPLSWTKAIHNSCGNILLSDGAVVFFTSEPLTLAARWQGEPTNRLVIP
jgi:type II secretory pathway pseudopilin PulG